jgi:hypothetical protein
VTIAFVVLLPLPHAFPKLLLLIGFFFFLGYKSHFFFLFFKVKVGFFTTIPSFSLSPLVCVFSFLLWSV